MNATEGSPEPADETTVLVVDDAPASRYALGAVLRRAGHQVVPAASAGEALIELDTLQRAGALPDVALVDIGLPDMSGYELCRRIKELPLTSGMPVVHFSAKPAGPGDRTRGLDAGADAYFTVPAEPEEIQAVVRAAVRGARFRSTAEAESARLSLLAEAVLAVQAARCPKELATATATGAARLSGSPAVAFVSGADGELVVGTSRRRASHALPDASAAEEVVRLSERLMAGRTGVQSTIVPSPMWPAGYFRAGQSESARLLVACGSDTRPPVCVAVPAYAATGDGPGEESSRLLARLVHAAALAAEPLLMYEVERNIALTLQHSFLPKRLPAMPGTEVVVRYVPASRHTEIGGDFYAALTTDEGVLVGVGDVVGHSLDAATVMVEIRHALRAYAVETSDPQVLVERLDRLLMRYHPHATATVCLALIDPGTGRSRIANAGHIPPLIVEDGAARYCAASGPLLGIGLDHPEPTELKLAPHERLLMVTDGLIETRGIDLGVSLEHLRQVAAGGPADLGTLCDTLLSCFGYERADDIALLAVRLAGEAG
ncbi:fused response regulator/phosphatase [Streptomyces indicus]|uniref:Serine phosphatase RsbU, regulator of sigma subunit n=1 Tax=Streptomyces indicus TaxID=417292 RepID=A0A1G8YPZ3_9ACTN|nr:fused response regulator/phosphatase [Streptomyces indicus]SDK04120.1 Serine phosphatase RsbU, regulator of sigma subunit [Streptomyces indicus]